MIRGYDHGMPTYNDLRVAYGLDPVASFAGLTGEATELFPDDPAIDAANPIDDPDILDFVLLADADGTEIALDSDEAETSAVTAIRRSTTAARLKAVFGDVDSVDAFTGMVSEPHVEGTEFGELQLAMWSRQFQALRDGDRFFYGNDPALDAIAEVYGIDYRVELADLIVANTEIERSDLPVSAFLLDDEHSDEAAQTDDIDDDIDDIDDSGDIAELADGGDEPDDDRVDRRRERPRVRDRDTDRPRRDRPRPNG